MSKVEIAGPQRLLEDVVSLVEDAGDFHVEVRERAFAGKEVSLGAERPGDKTYRERIFLGTVRRKVEELLSYIPPAEARESRIEPQLIIDDIAGLIDEHLSDCRDLAERKEALRKEKEELIGYVPFLNAMFRLLEGVGPTPDIDFIGLTLRNPAVLPRLTELLSGLTEGQYDLISSPASDGTEVLLVTVPKKLSPNIRKIFQEEQIPEMGFPASLSAMSLPEKFAYLEKRISEIDSETATVEGELGKFAERWSDRYKAVKEWLDERLSVLGATAFAFRTEMCFILCGWIPKVDVEQMAQALAERFDGQVVLEEREILEHELKDVPILLRNPLYFKPFELFTRLLPLPRYTSYDPTTFIGIFFPIFFGMILGDAGYGILLMALSLWLMRKYKGRETVRSAARILLISSMYAAFFGFLYGEVFGELGFGALGLEPLCVERREAVIPMLVFTVGIGFFHVCLGLFLGFLSAFRKGAQKEAAYKLLSILFIVAVTVLVASRTGFLPRLLSGPVLVAVVALVPLILIVGGLMGSLELLRSIGNIISYARIMAVGLASVLLAFVANRVSGIPGDILLGILAGALLHAVNIVLGVFSPTIHSIRLHYVEFFSKFLEHGGRKFEPLKKEGKKEAK
jgi:V/A-type H+-transporting ATPase subunit I